MEEQSEEKLTKNQSYVQMAKKLYVKEKEAWSNVYKAALEDLRFLSDEPEAQWEDRDYRERERTGRPALTLDKLGQFTRQVVNQIRMNTPTINVIPAKDGDEKTAEIFKGLIKNIEYQSRADDAYDTAALYQVRSSIGWIRVDHEYADDEGFEQNLCIKRVVNNLSCYLDSDSIEADGCDAKHAFIVDKMKVSDFKEMYPDFACVGFDEADPAPDKLANGDYITIVEFFKVEEEEKEIGAYEDGVREVSEDDEVKPKSTRKIKKRRIKRCKMSGQDVLEETTFPGKYIPLVPVYGEEFWIEGRRNIFSLIRKAKTAQQLHNYWKSLETELLMKQPQAPIMAAEGQVEEYADDWKNPSKAMVLRYKQRDADGQAAPPPQRLMPPQTPTGVFQAALATVDDIKAAIGMYNASLGMQSNETSGIAIQRRKAEGDIANYHFADNLAKSVQQVGRILVNAIPEIYDTPRIIRIIGDEEQPEAVGINGAIAPEQEQPFDLRQGKYDVRVTTGASFTTMRQEAAEFYTQIITQNPAMLQVAGDLIFSKMDIPGAQALADRLKKTIPPQLLEENNQQDPQVMALQQQLEQAATALQQVQAQMAQMAQQLQDKQAELQIKAQSEVNKAEADRMKLQIEQLQLQMDAQQAQAENAIKLKELELKEKELALKELAAMQANEIAVAQSIANNGVV